VPPANPGRGNGRGISRPARSAGGVPGIGTSGGGNQVRTVQNELTVVTVASINEAACKYFGWGAGNEKVSLERPNRAEHSQPPAQSLAASTNLPASSAGRVNITS
jgi:hypothetical protein